MELGVQTTRRRLARLTQCHQHNNTTPSFWKSFVWTIVLITTFFSSSSFSSGLVLGPNINRESVLSNQLVGVVVLVRHGGRTPTRQMLCPRDEPGGDWPFRVGAGELTALGRKESLLLGQFLSELYLQKFPCASAFNNTLPAVGSCVDFYSTNVTRAKETAVFILQAFFESSQALPDDLEEQSDKALRHWQRDAQLDLPGRKFRASWDVADHRLDSLYSLVQVVDNENAFSFRGIKDIKKEQHEFRANSIVYRQVVEDVSPAVEAFRAIGCKFSQSKGVLSSLKSLYQTKLTYQSHALPLPTQFENLDDEVWVAASMAADLFWRYTAPTPRAAWFAGGGALIEATHRLTLQASLHAGRPVVDNMEEWLVVSQSVSARLRNPREVPAPFVLYAAHRDSVIVFQRALHVAESDLYIPDFIGFLGMELWHDVDLERRCLKNTRYSDALHCAAVGYGVRVLLNGERLLPFPRAVVALDCELSGDLSDGCAERRTSTVSLMSLQKLLISDWSRYGNVRARQNSKSVT